MRGHHRPFIICERVLIICVGMRIICACMRGTFFLASTHRSRQSRMFSSTSAEKMDTVRSHSAHSPPHTHVHKNTHTSYMHIARTTCTHTSGRYTHTRLHCTLILPPLIWSPAVAHICAIAMMGLAGAVAMLAHGQSRTAAIRREQYPHNAALTSPTNGHLCIHSRLRF